MYVSETNAVLDERRDLEFPFLFKVGKIGRMALRNRLIMPAMETNLSTVNGEVSEDMIAYYVRRASDIGLIIVEYSCVDAPVGLGSPNQLRIDHDRYISGHYTLVEAVHAEGAKIALQLHHAGRQTLSKWNDVQPVAPSPIPCKMMKSQPRELSTNEVRGIVEAFVRAARRAVSAGYDAIELHAAHGYLLAEFLSPYTNKRTDEYGGSIENRVRIIREIISGIRTKVSATLPIIVRYSADEFVSEGVQLEDAILIGESLDKAGADALHITTGIHETLDRNCDPMDRPQAWRVPYAESIKQRVKIPVITVGVIREPEVANSILENDRADFIALGRALIADPDWPAKARTGQVKNIRKCISCNVCVDFYTPLRCALNAVVGHERKYEPLPLARETKRVVVVGGSLAGMEVARVARLRGHTVDLYEAEDHLAAGQFSLSWVAPGKDKILWLRDFLIHQMHELGVNVHLSSPVTADSLQQLSMDAFVVATGAKAVLPDLKNVNGNVVSAHDVLSGHPLQRNTAIVLGGRATGCETALTLAKQGFNVTLLSRSPARDLASDESYVNGRNLLRLIREANVRVLTSADLIEVKNNEAKVSLSEVDAVESIPADNVVVAWGVRPVNNLYEAAAKLCDKVFAIGDAREVGNFQKTIYEAYVLGMRL
ncbi:NAD(P)/FAD-dependent oxidoreductase [Alicyclobacillus dauci]|uniref:NAD(P)/FAD-dependent oxidoreductase n=1 Tax=Alicyclobacillus dauci TaxID=1475485 RepID=A0ABY6Z0S6_9BACL|nr:NAD(P)/FAD-dependent oxidoreductase [Alicyclobacillus dauci]WAH36193.1 NAD(P)/FAD-dependent oxidoreductase [Alicyclobacillus dauci]